MVKILLSFFHWRAPSWSSLEVGDDGCIGPSRKLLCLCQAPKIYAAHAWHNSIHVWLLGCGQSFKHFTLINYDSRVVIWGYFPVRYESRVVIYERKMFIRLATDRKNKYWALIHATLILEHSFWLEFWFLFYFSRTNLSVHFLIFSMNQLRGFNIRICSYKEFSALIYATLELNILIDW